VVCLPCRGGRVGGGLGPIRPPSVAEAACGVPVRHDHIGAAPRHADQVLRVGDLLARLAAVESEQLLADAKRVCRDVPDVSRDQPRFAEIRRARFRGAPQDLAAEVEEKPPLGRGACGGAAAWHPLGDVRRGGELREGSEDGHYDVLARLEAAVRRVHQRQGAPVVPVVLAHGGGRVARAQLRASPRGDEDRRSQLDGRHARALVVREGKHVVSPTRGVPPGVARADPVQRGAVVRVAEDGRAAARLDIEVVPRGRAREARDVAAAVDRHEEEVGVARVEGAVWRNEQRLVERELESKGIVLPHRLVPLLVPPVHAVGRRHPRLRSPAVELRRKIVHKHGGAQPPLALARASSGAAAAVDIPRRGESGQGDRAVGATVASGAAAPAAHAHALRRVALIETDGADGLLAGGAGGVLVAAAAEEGRHAASERRLVDVAVRAARGVGRRARPHPVQLSGAEGSRQVWWRRVGAAPQPPRLGDAVVRPPRVLPLQRLLDAPPLAQIHLAARVARARPAEAAVGLEVAAGGAAREHVRVLGPARACAPGTAPGRVRARSRLDADGPWVVARLRVRLGAGRTSPAGPAEAATSVHVERTVAVLAAKSGAAAAVTTGRRAKRCGRVKHRQRPEQVGPAAKAPRRAAKQRTQRGRKGRRLRLAERTRRPPESFQCRGSGSWRRAPGRRRWRRSDGKRRAGIGAPRV